MALGFGTHEDGTWWLVATCFRQILPDGTRMSMPLDPPIVIGKPPEDIYAEQEDTSERGVVGR